MQLFDKLNSHKEQSGTVEIAGPVQYAIFGISGVAFIHFPVFNGKEYRQIRNLDPIGGNLIGGNDFYAAFFIFFPPYRGR